MLRSVEHLQCQKVEHDGYRSINHLARKVGDRVIMDVQVWMVHQNF